ncbi:hypothetical protein ACFVX6_34235 [Streptomyces sp. NPDC058289]|uniref:hypothetical protein n=1 Tax=Streptomyces sp. NPDC058289 TaxID=3346425 RepID=UPI0036F11346
MNEEHQLVEILRSLDRVPCSSDLETPDGFDFEAARAGAVQLQNRLSKDLEFPWELSDENQDASYYFAVHVQNWLPALAIRLSNYGKLAVVTTPNPDSHRDLDHAVRDGAVTAQQREAIETALIDLGYTAVPLPLLRRRYDGVTWLADLNAEDHSFITYPADAEHVSWWTRYFEHI